MARPVLLALSMLERSLAMGLSLLCAAACSNLADRQVVERASDDSNSGGSDGDRGGAETNGGRTGSAAGGGGAPMALAGAGGTSGAAPSGGAAGMAGTPSRELPACSKQPSVMPLHALSVWEYERTVEALTGTVVSAKLANGSIGPGLFEALVLDAPTVSQLFDEVEHQRIVTRTASSPWPCDPGLGVLGMCVDRLIDAFVAGAFRGPLSVPEKLRYRSLFQVAAANGDAAAGTALVVEAALLSPRFLLQGLPEPATSAAAERPLSQYELASRLSFALTGAPPDYTLNKTAENRQLEGEGYAEQVKRLLYAPVYGDPALHFFSRWLGLDELDLLLGPGAVPGLTPELVASLRQETELFLGNAVIDNDSLVNLLQASSTFVDARLAGRYGFSPPASGFVSVPLDAGRYSGILTQGSTLARFNNPARRGRFVQNRLLCTVVPDSPPGVDTKVVVSANQTRRQAWEAHLNGAPVCRSCHQLMDPTGFAFERFNELGEYQQTENGLPIDTTGSVLIGDAPVPLDGPVDLANAIASSDTWAECISRTLLSYVLERPLEASDDCTVKQLAQPFKDSHQQPLTELLANIVQTHAFKYRDQATVNDVPAPPLGNGDPTQSDVARKLFLLDFVIAETSWLSSEMPLEARPLFDQYLDSLRQLQQQLSSVVGGPGPQP